MKKRDKLDININKGHQDGHYWQKLTVLSTLEPNVDTDINTSNKILN
jgi:hypothetical protein